MNASTPASEYSPRAEMGLHCETVLLQFLRAVRRFRPPGANEPAQKVDLDALLRERELRLDLLTAQAPYKWSRPAVRLAEGLALSEDECSFLWAAVAVAIQPGLRAEGLQGEDLDRGLTVDLWARVSMIPHRDNARDLAMKLQRGPLVHSGVLRVGRHGRTPLWTPYVPAPVVIEYLAGEPVSGGRIDERWTVVPEQLVTDVPQAGALADLAGARPGTLTVVEGTSGSGRTTAIGSASAGPLRCVDLWGANVAMIEALLLDLRTAVALLGGTPLLRNVDWLWSRDDLGPGLAAVAAFVDDADVPVYATVRAATGDVPTRAPVRRVRWSSPGSEARGRLWRALLAARSASAADDVIDGLARRYPLGPRAIAEAITSARSAMQTADGARADLALTEVALATAVRRGSRQQIGDLGRVVSVRHDWNDLVLPAVTREQVDLVVSRVRNAEQVLGTWGFGEQLGAATGTIVLLSGPSGTGKSMIAGLITRALDRELFAIDLSRILSKWIGETEQRLSRVFDAAESGHLAILIDEADALFAQRARNVETANDRFSNMDIDYLLDRLDRFSGLAFLTSNLDETIDVAMRRRFAAHIALPRPGESERAQLWRRHLATGRAPIDPAIDVGDLARRFPQMTGGNIRNAVLAAAFLAAEARDPSITHAHLVRAARIEYTAMGEAPPPSLRTVPPEPA